MKHIHKNTNGRKFSLDVEACEDEYFINLSQPSKFIDNPIKTLVTKSWKGLKLGFSPTLCESGVGGTYFMHDEHNRTIGVFKPQDEEMGCLNNPKGFTPKSDSYKDDSAKRGVLVGEAAYRECAAYLLDHEHFAGVPATDLVVCNHPCFSSSLPLVPSADDNVKIGSFQEYKEHDFDAQDISPSKASKFPVNEVHKIAILDIRLFNTDRHGGNILVRKVRNNTNRLRRSSDYEDSDFEYDAVPRRTYDSDADENGVMDNQMQFRMDIGSDEEDDDRYYNYDSSDSEESVSYTLIPIDHGYTLPHTLSGLSDSWFEWLNWPQARTPFSEDAKAYISRLDADKDIALLRQKFGDWIRPECYKVLKITTMWLKIGAHLGLTPYDIGQMMCRKNVDLPSDLEKMCWEAEALVEADTESDGSDADMFMDELFFKKLMAVMERTAANRKIESESQLKLKQKVGQFRFP